MNKQLTSNLLWIMLSSTILIPKISAGFLSLGLDDILSLVTFPYILYLFSRGAFNGVYRIRSITALCVLILLTGILFSIIGAYLYVGGIHLPTEMWQYFKRFVFLFWAIYLISSRSVSPAFAIKTLMVVTFVTLLIGLVQIVPNPIGNLFSSIYSTTETQLSALVDSAEGTNRNFSVSGFSTSWGGFCLFIFAIFSSQLFQKDKKAGGELIPKLPALVCIFLTLLNVFFSGSRGALLAAGISLFAFIVLYFFSGSPTVKIKILFWTAALGFMSYFILFTFFSERLEFIQYRNDVLMREIDDPNSRVDASRFVQIALGIDALDGPYAWIFGISNKGQRQNVIEWGVEVEYVYMLINYGIFGVLLRYYLIWIVFKRSWRLFKPKTFVVDDRFAMRLGLMGMLSIIGYLVFSFAYFFYQEPVVGLTPWLLFGCIMGYPTIGKSYAVNLSGAIEAG